MRTFSVLGFPALCLSHVYENTDLRSKIPESIHSEAEGWAIPWQTPAEPEPTIWFSTALGNVLLGYERVVKRQERYNTGIARVDLGGKLSEIRSV